jgi:multiple sugar transport system permease protein
VSAVEGNATPVTGAPRPRGRATREQVEIRVLRVLRVVGIAFFLVITLFPFYYMGLLSVRSISEVLESPADLIVSFAEINFDAYSEVLSPVDSGGLGFLDFILNSALIGIGAVGLSILFALPGAYAVSRLQFFGKRSVNALFLSVYIFPTIVLAIPLFVFFSQAGLRGSLFPLVIVYASQTLPVAIYMLRNYLDAIPREIEEAALADGCSRLGVIRRISLPLAMPAILATCMYVFMIAWNEYLFALLFLVENRDAWTVSLGVSQLDSFEVPTTVLMAGSVILTIPIVVLFFFAERFLVQGLTEGGVKG